MIPLGLKTAESAIDAAFQKKVFGSGTTALIISNEEMEVIMKIDKSIKESGLLIKRNKETIKNDAKKQKGRFFGMLLGTLAASLLENALSGRGVIMPPHPLTNFEIQKCY